MSTKPRFFVPNEFFVPNAESVVLPSDAAHHAVQVLRLRVGESLILHDGDNRAYEAVLENISGKNATARIVNQRLLQSEPRTRITVAQSLPKTSDKIEQVLQHGTEVGAAGFVLFAANRSVARLAANEKVEKRLERWRGIVQSASEQSGRGRLPVVEWQPFPKDVAALFSQFDAVLLADEIATVPLKSTVLALPKSVKNVLVLIGPEGGFTPEEAALFTDAGAASVSLGARILRTETAALVMLAQILFALEENGG